MKRPITINLSPRFSECAICGEELVDARQGLPMFEGRVVAKDDGGAWAGFDCCRPCLEAYERGGPEEVEKRRTYSVCPDCHFRSDTPLPGDPDYNDPCRNAWHDGQGKRPR